MSVIEQLGNTLTGTSGYHHLEFTLSRIKDIPKDRLMVLLSSLLSLREGSFKRQIEIESYLREFSDLTPHLVEALSGYIQSNGLVLGVSHVYIPNPRTTDKDHRRSFFGTRRDMLCGVAPELEDVQQLIELNRTDSEMFKSAITNPFIVFATVNTANLMQHTAYVGINTGDRTYEHAADVSATFKFTPVEGDTGASSLIRPYGIREFVSSIARDLL